MYTVPSSNLSSNKNGTISVPASLRDSLSCLDIVGSNMFETEDINPEEARKHEAEFLKGAPLQWITLAKKGNSPLVKRDGFTDLIELIKRKKREQYLVTDVSFRYQPRGGGSTLAMQVLWHFRKDLRCARVIDSDLDTKELSKQVVDLFLLSSEEQAKQDRKTVLLLLDTKQKINNQPIKNLLWEDLLDEIRKRGITTYTTVVIMLNCIPTDFTLTDTMILTTNLAKEKFKEQLLQQIRLQREGSKKVTTISLLHQKHSGGSELARKVLKDLREEFTCETLTEPFRTQTVENIANELMRKYEMFKKPVLLLLDHENDKPSLLKHLLSKLQGAKEADHPAFIVINAVSKSIVRAKDEEKFKMKGGFQKENEEKPITEEMAAYVENHKDSRSTRLLSFLALINSYVPGSNLSTLHCQEFMDQTDEGNPTLETRMKPFMNLIYIFSVGKQDQYIQLKTQMIADACLNMFTRANESKQVKSDIALDFLNSLVKGNESKYKRLCNRMLVKRQEEEGKMMFSRVILDILNESENNTKLCVDLLKQASELFSEDPFYPQALARLYYIEVNEDNKYEKAREWAEEAIKRHPNNSHIIDTLGQVHKYHLLYETEKSSDIDVCLPIARSAINAFKAAEEAAEESGDHTTLHYSGLFGFMQVCKIIHLQMPLEQEYISNLKDDVEMKYEPYVRCLLAFSRQSFKEEDPDYMQYFKQSEENDETTLNEKKIKSFEGLLHFLKSDINVLKQSESALKNPQTDNEVVLYILANIILSQSGEPWEKAEDLQVRLQKLWAAKAQDRSPEFYLLILLLFWPDEAQPGITNPPDLRVCVQKMNQSYKKKYNRYLQGRYLVPLFFLGEGTGLQRLIHLSKQDEIDLELLNEGQKVGEVKCLQRINGKVENDLVFAVINGHRVKVTPQNRASVCEQGHVTFFLGFNIRGPVAYNIRYDESCKQCFIFQTRIQQTFVSGTVSAVFYKNVCSLVSAEVVREPLDW